MKIKFLISNYKFLAAVIILAAVVRLVGLGQFPNGFTGDEAQQGYSAYSILITGKDEWGQILPLFPRGFGDYKPPLYTYITIPSVAFLGLTVEAVRIPAALVGILSVILIYFLAKELLKDEKIALWSSFLLAINPWHIQLSRTAWEGGLGILTFSMGLLFYLKSGIRNQILAAIFWGITLYSYHSWRVFVVLFLLGLFLTGWKKIKGWNRYIVPLLFLIIFSLPIFFNINSVISRSSDVGIFSSTQITGFFTEKGTTPLPPIIERLLDNKFLYIANQFAGNYLSYYSFIFYFSSSRPDNTYLNFPYFPILYLVELAFWFFAIYLFINRRVKNSKIIILWFFLSAVPASLAVGFMNANRAPTFLPLASMISALGVVYILDRWGHVKKIILSILGISFILFLHFYFYTLPQKPPDNLRYGYDMVFKKVLEVENIFDEIVISKTFTEPQIFIAFYKRMDPNEFQKASQDWLRYENAGKRYVDQLESYNLGKFLFEDINWDKKDSLRKNALIVSKTEDFPSNVNSILDIKNPKGRVIFRMVPVNNEKDN